LPIPMTLAAAVFRPALGVRANLPDGLGLTCCCCGVRRLGPLNPLVPTIQGVTFTPGLELPPTSKVKPFAELSHINIIGSPGIA